MNLPRALVGTLATCALLALAGCDRAKPQSAPAPKADPAPTQSVPDTKENRLTESSWIVKEIVRDMADMVGVTSEWKKVPIPESAISIEALPPDEAGHHYKVTLDAPCKVTLPIDIAGSIWDPAAYQTAASLLLEPFHLTHAADQTRIDGDPVNTLTNPLAKTIQQENERIGAMLNAHPLSPEAHEQAALVVAVLGLRENSGALWDTRAMNNRATAHLALARALRRGDAMSDAGEIAELLISLEADTKKDSDERIARLKSRAEQNPDLDPWIMAAQLRNTRDWRLLSDLGDPASASLLERIEFFRAQCEAVSTDVAAKQLFSGTPDSISDWANIALQMDFSVESGHIFTDHCLALALREISEVFPESRNAQLTPQILAQFLNQAPTSAVSRDNRGNPTQYPIDQGMWAHFFQRQLCHLMSRTDYFLREKSGDPEQAEKFEGGISNLFSQLTFSPVLHVLWNSPKHPDRTGDEQTAELIKRHPEWITESVWKEVQRPDTAQALQAWHSPGTPVGTAYRYASRRTCIRNPPFHP